MTAAIIPIKEPRQVRLRRALYEWRVANAQWFDKTIALAIELKEARDECGADDAEFGRWLVENGCDDLNTNDRAALIKFAEHVELARRVLPETNSRSPQLIWKNEIKPLAFPNVRKGPEQQAFPNVRKGPENAELIEARKEIVLLREQLAAATETLSSGDIENGKQPKDRNQNKQRRFERTISVIKDTIDGADDMVVPHDVSTHDRLYAIQDISHSMARLAVVINKLTGKKEEVQS